MKQKAWLLLPVILIVGSGVLFVRSLSGSDRVSRMTCERINKEMTWKADIKFKEVEALLGRAPDGSNGASHWWIGSRGQELVVIGGDGCIMLCDFFDETLFERLQKLFGW